MKTKLTFLDIAIIVGVSCFALLLAFLPKAFLGKAMAVKIMSPTYEETFSLDRARDITIESEGHVLVVHIDENGAYVKASDCDDKICQNSGVIQKSGEIIVCAPAGVRIEMISGNSEVDYVVG